MSDYLMFQKVIDDNTKNISKQDCYLSNEKDKLCSDIDHYLLSVEKCKNVEKSVEKCKI